MTIRIGQARFPSDAGVVIAAPFGFTSVSNPDIRQIYLGNKLMWQYQTPFTVKPPNLTNVRGEFVQRTQLSWGLIARWQSSRTGPQASDVPTGARELGGNVYIQWRWRATSSAAWTDWSDFGDHGDQPRNLVASGSFRWPGTSAPFSQAFIIRRDREYQFRMRSTYTYLHPRRAHRDTIEGPPSDWVTSAVVT